MAPHVKVIDGTRLSQSLSAAELARRGVSVAGARHVLNAEIVTSPVDRRKLAQIISEELGLAGGQIVPLALFLPAAQMLRDSLKKLAAGFGTGLSVRGAQQFLAGLPINNAADRQSLAEVFYAVLDRRVNCEAAKNMVLKGKKILQN